MKNLVKRIFPASFAYAQSRKRVWDAYYRHGEYELRELPRYVARRSLAIDVGGNTGVYTYHLSRLAARVVTFEPNPDYVAQIRALNLRNVTIEPAALSSVDGSAILRIPRFGTGAEDAGMASLATTAFSDAVLARTIEVPVRRLDGFGFDDVGFIKIDVEGFEEAVLGGARETIARHRPVLLIEIEERHNRGGLARIAAGLAAQGYHGFFFDRGVRTPLDAFSGDLHQRIDAIQEGAAHRRSVNYVNNFLFVPSP